jgi:arylsulfatase A-like enzyme
VTTDHGRSNAFRDHGGFAPESGRVWLVASGGKIADKGLVYSREPHRLADIAPTMRALLGVAPDVREGAGRVIEEAL